MIWRLTNAVLSALLAPPCAVCAGVLDEPLNGAVCPRCWQAVAPAPRPFLRSGPISDAVAIGEYDGTLREIIHALKYDGRRSVAPRLAALIAEHGRRVLADADAVVPVPLHPMRERERGFNQADDLARGLGLPVWRVLRRRARTRPQVELPAAERRKNVRSAFAMARGRVDVAGTVLVLVDDVTTTGATLEACARVLHGAGARDVRALTAARASIGLR